MAPARIEEMKDLDWAEGWSHVRVDLTEGIKSETVGRLLAKLPPTTTLQLGLTLDEAAGAFPGAVELLSEHSQRISALLLRSANSPLPSTRVIARLREMLRGGPAGSIPLLAMPNGYFVEFNRGVPLEVAVDGVAFPLSSTVHSDDGGTITENIPAVVDMVRTARRLTGKSIISISPLALYHPPLAIQGRFPRSLITPWLSGVVSHAAVAGVSSITLSQDVVNGLGRVCKINE
jgi:hypothetical protein